MKKLLFVLFIIPAASSFNSAYSQSFGTDGTVKYVQKSVTSSTPAHEYFQLYNFSGDSLPMRWRVVDSLTFHPSQWEIALQDNLNYHNPIIDSSDFVLPDTVGAMDKIILNVSPVGTIGYGEIVIELINLDSLAEKTRITFQVEIMPATGIAQNGPDNGFQSLIYPNPVQNQLMICNNEIITRYAVYNSIGVLVFSENTNSDRFTINTEGLSAGTYILEVFSNNSVSFSRFQKQ